MYPVFTNLNNGSFIFLLLTVLLLPACSNMPGTNTASQDSSSDKTAGNKINREFQQALALMQKKDMPGAAEKFYDLVDRYPQMTGAWANIGLIHMKAHEWEKARHALQQAIRLNPNHAPAYNYLGVLERKLGQFKQAEQAYAKAIDADPGYAIAWLNLGILYDVYLDKPALALPQYEQYQRLTANADSMVKKWIVELKRRLSRQSRLSVNEGGRLNG